MRLNNVSQQVGNAAFIGGKLAIRIFKLGLTRLAIQNLQEYERDNARDISGQIERGYTEKVAPQLKGQLGKFNIIKGGKE